MADLNIKGTDRLNYLQSRVLVKEDKKHRCYNFFQMFENLEEMKAEDFALAIKGKPEGLNCTKASDLLFNLNVPTRF